MQQTPSNEHAHAAPKAEHPHEMTQGQFVALAKVTRLENHGRKWVVRYGGDHAFSDAGTAHSALIDVHRASVNNALHLNEQPVSAASRPSVPTMKVLENYPDLAEKYSGLLGAAARTVPLPKVSSIEFDALVAGLFLLAASLEDGRIQPDDGDIWEVLTGGGKHQGLSADQVSNLRELIQFE